LWKEERTLILNWQGVEGGENVNTELEVCGKRGTRLDSQFGPFFRGGVGGRLNRKTHTVLVRNSLRSSLIDNSVTFT
jgi:hypothetical protein